MIDHDRLFKELIATFFLEFLDLFLPQVRAFVDEVLIEFLDKDLFVDVTQGERLEPDLVAKVKFKGSPAFFIIHVEAQSQAQKSFGHRLFTYFSRLHDKYALPVYPIAVLGFSHPRTPQPNIYRVSFPNKTVMEFNYDVIQLNQLGWRDFISRPNPVAAALMSKMNIAYKDRTRVKLECLRLLTTLKLDKARLKLIYGFVDTYLQLNAQEQAEFDSRAKTLGIGETEEVMEIVTSWMRQGIKQGRKEGRKEGREAGRKEGREEGLEEGRKEGLEEGQLKASQDGVIEILTVRFGRVSADLRKAIRTVDNVSRLKALLREAVKAESASQFQQGLARPAQRNGKTGPRK